MFLLDKRQLWDLKLENLEVNFGQFKKNKGITAASGNVDDHLDLSLFKSHYILNNPNYSRILIASRL